MNDVGVFENIIYDEIMICVFLVDMVLIVFFFFIEGLLRFCILLFVVIIFIIGFW